MRLVINPVSLILHAVCQCGLPTAVTLVQAPISFVYVAIGRVVEPFAMPHIAERVTLRNFALHAHRFAYSSNGLINRSKNLSCLVYVAVRVFQSPVFLHLEVVWCRISIEILTANIVNGLF